MKKLIALLFLSLICSANIISQDTSIVNYYPTRVGNVWVYSYSAFGNTCGCYQYLRTAIIDSVLKYGKTYYVSHTTQRITFPGTCGTYGYDTTRVDPVSGNIFRFSEPGNCYLVHEIVIDSLRSRKGDTLKNCAQYPPPLVCTDTGTTTVFGLNWQFKTFGVSYIDGSWGRQYLRGIGFSRYTSSFAAIPPSCNTIQNILGCVINGTVYGDTTFTPPDTSLISYLPLKVGNVWVYHGSGYSAWGSSDWYDRFELTSTQQANGKVYHNFNHQRRIVNAVGSYIIFSPTLFASDSAVRIDSTTLNTYTKMSCGESYESLVDSLKANKNDTFKVCETPGPNKRVCLDTSNFNIFGYNLPSKYFAYPGFEGENSQKYVKNFGICWGRMSFLMETYTTNLAGCVINGIVYGDTAFIQSHTVTGIVRYRDNNQIVTSGYVKAYRHSYLGYMDVLDSAAIQPNGTYTLNKIPGHDTTDLMAFQNDEITNHDFVPTYYISTIYWQDAEHLFLSNDTSGIDINVYRVLSDTTGTGIIGGGVYGYTAADIWIGIGDARLYAVSQSTFRSYDISNEDGQYSIDSLPPGYYQIICNRIGFETQTRNVYLGNTNRNDINFYFDHLVASKGKDNIPKEYALYQNYPNPFNPVTSIRFQIPQSGIVSLKIYDVLGREAAVLLNGQLNPGSYEVGWDATNYPSGVYFYKLLVTHARGSQTFTDSKKMVLIK